MLFAKGKRPDRVDVRAFAEHQQAARISNDPFGEDASAQPPPVWPGQPLWVELLRDGLTFDLSGIAPGAQCEFPVIAHRFDLAELPTGVTHDALAFLPGPHLASASRSQPVVRTMFALVCDLIEHFEDLEAVCWGPSRSALGRRCFLSIVRAWLDGGPFPALGLTAFIAEPDNALTSEGLAFWIGQELRIEPPLGNDTVAATRLGVRLVNQLVLSGAVTADDRIIGPDGAPLVLRPSQDRSIISVRRE